MDVEAAGKLVCAIKGFKYGREYTGSPCVQEPAQAGALCRSGSSRARNKKVISCPLRREMQECRENTTSENAGTVQAV